MKDKLLTRAFCAKDAGHLITPSDFGGALSPLMPRGLAALEQLATAFTLVYNGEVVGVIGYIGLTPDVCEVFLLPAAGLRNCVLPFARRAHKLFDVLSMMYRRVQASGIDDQRHNRLFEFLGMRREGTMLSYGPRGENFGMWAVTR